MNEFHLFTSYDRAGSWKPIIIRGSTLDVKANNTDVLETFTTSGGTVRVQSGGTFTDNGSTFQVGGSLSVGYIAKSASYSLTGSDYTVEVTATGQTMTLPTAASIAGRTYCIKLTASGTCTVATTSSQTIDGSTTYSLSAQYKYVTVQSNGTNWVIIANN